MARKVPKYMLRRYFKPDGTEDIYECKLCGERVKKRNRTRHLMSYHPEVYERLLKEVGRE